MTLRADHWLLIAIHVDLPMWAVQLNRMGSHEVHLSAALLAGQRDPPRALCAHATPGPVRWAAGLAVTSSRLHERSLVRFRRFPVHTRGRCDLGRCRCGIAGCRKCVHRCASAHRRSSLGRRCRDGCRGSACVRGFVANEGTSSAGNRVRGCRHAVYRVDARLR